MPEKSNPLSALWPVASSGATDWLFELCGDGLTGFMPPAMSDAVWVLNAMYEHEHGPGDVSHHEYRQMRLADGSIPRDIVAGIDLDAVGVATGGVGWVAPSTLVPAGGGCVGRSSPGGPVVRSFPTGACPPLVASPRP
ncbi:hypothetical protein ACFRCG_12855 [Embleya sp. NPDC056575]|uniref:hypothetical protein n=1 Tax=unclassified Embleya TaxID=2699296 RepID=UPI0036B15DA6